MDFYNYFLHKLETRKDKNMAMHSIKDITLSLLDGPIPVGLDAAVGCLEALHTWSNPTGEVVAPIFEEVELALSTALYGVRCDVELSDEMWANECSPEPPDGRYPMDEGEEDTTMPCPGPDYPDIENWGNWTDSDWIRFQSYKKKVLAPAACHLSTVAQVTNLLALVEANLSKLAIDKKCVIAEMCTDLADSIYELLETFVIDTHANSTLTVQGRLVQKAMHTATTE